MTCSVFAAHLDLEDHVLTGALFLTYRLDLGAFEEWILPKLLPLRHPPGDRLFAEEARRRIAETPIAIVADASCLEQAGSDGSCGVPVVRFAQPGGAFHPKLGLLACRSRGIRVVIGSANLTEAGITEQIELMSSFWLNDHPSAAPGLRAILRVLDRCLGNSPSYLRAAKLVERAFPKARGDEPSPLVLCSSTPILDQVLKVIAKDTGGKGRIEEVSIVSPFFERGLEDRSLLQVVDQRIRRHLPHSREPHYVLRLPTVSRSAPYRVEAPVDRLRAFANVASFECRVLTPERRRWTDDPSADEDMDRRPRALHGKLVVFRVRHGGSSSVYTLLGSPNFTKAALLGANFEIALLQRAAKTPAGLDLPADKVSAAELLEDVRELKAAPRETSCIDRIVMSVCDQVLQVVAAEGATLPDALGLRTRGRPLSWQRMGANAVVHPFDDATCSVAEVRLEERWYTLPIEIVDPEVAAGAGARELSLEELLERSTAYAKDPDGVGVGGARGRRDPKAPAGLQVQLTSMADVAPQLKSICELAIAFETSLAQAPTPEALTARFRAYFAPTLRALAGRARSSQFRTHAFALLDVQRAAERLRAKLATSEKDHRSAFEQICAECAEWVSQLERAVEPAESAPVSALRRRFERV